MTILIPMRITHSMITINFLLITFGSKDQILLIHMQQDLLRTDFFDFQVLIAIHYYYPNNLLVKHPKVELLIVDFLTQVDLNYINQHLIGIGY